jgi:hypothetical protein
MLLKCLALPPDRIGHVTTASPTLFPKTRPALIRIEPLCDTVEAMIRRLPLVFTPQAEGGFTALWWWAPPVVLGLAVALIPAEPHYSPHSFSDGLVLARRLLLGSAVLYFWIVLLIRMLRALIPAPRQDDARRGFDVIARSDGPRIDGAK